MFLFGQWFSPLSHCPFCFFDKHDFQKQLQGEKGFFHLTLPVTSRDVGKTTPRQKTERRSTDWLALWLLIYLFSYTFRTTCPQWAGPSYIH